MGSGAACKCGGRLSLGTEIASGTCGHCSRDTRHLREPVVSQPKVVSQEVRQVVSHGPDSGEMETKEQRWRRTHADQRKAIHRDGQRRRRAE